MGIELYSDKPKQGRVSVSTHALGVPEKQGLTRGVEWIGVFQLRTPRGWLQFPTRQKMLQSAPEKRWQHKMFILQFYSDPKITTIRVKVFCSSIFLCVLQLLLLSNSWSVDRQWFPERSAQVGSNLQVPRRICRWLIYIYIYYIYIYIVVYIDWLIQIGSSRYSFLMSWERLGAWWIIYPAPLTKNWSLVPWCSITSSAMPLDCCQRQLLCALFSLPSMPLGVDAERQST